MKVHVFMGKFESLDEAHRYTEAQWEPAPSAGAPDDVYDAWEARNPIWPMRSDLGVYLDSDFIETIGDDERLAYLRDFLKNPADLGRIQAAAPSDSNILVLIFKDALGGFKSKLTSTPRLSYCGEYRWDMGQRRSHRADAEDPL